MILDVLRGPDPTLTNGEIVQVTGQGQYIVKDSQGRQFSVRSNLTLHPGNKVLFKDDWIMSRAGTESGAKVYQV